MDPPASAPVFGQKVAGRHYRLRPGAYAVILDAERGIAVVRTTEGCYLPGGGCEPGESPEATLRREVREECGREIAILGRVGEAAEYIGGESEGDGFIKHGVFFSAVFGAPSPVAIEPDHALTWLSPPEADAVLSNRSHAWAVRRTLTVADSPDRESCAGNP